VRVPPAPNNSEIQPEAESDGTMRENRALIRRPREGRTRKVEESKRVTRWEQICCAMTLNWMAKEATGGPETAGGELANSLGADPFG